MKYFSVVFISCFFQSALLLGAPVPKAPVHKEDDSTPPQFHRGIGPTRDAESDAKELFLKWFVDLGSDDNTVRSAAKKSFKEALEKKDAKAAALCKAAGDKLNRNSGNVRALDTLKELTEIHPIDYENALPDLARWLDGNRENKLSPAQVKILNGVGNELENKLKTARAEIEKADPVFKAERIRVTEYEDLDDDDKKVVDNRTALEKKVLEKTNFKIIGKPSLTNTGSFWEIEDGKSDRFRVKLSCGAIAALSLVKVHEKEAKGTLVPFEKIFGWCNSAYHNIPLFQSELGGVAAVSPKTRAFQRVDPSMSPLEIEKFQKDNLAKYIEYLGKNGILLGVPKTLEEIEQGIRHDNEGDMPAPAIPGGLPPLPPGVPQNLPPIPQQMPIGV